MTSKTYFLKWRQTFLVSWSKITVYRFNFFLQVIGPALVFFFVKYNLWSSIYSSNASIKIEGYGFDDMIHYHAWALIVGLLAQGHASMNLSEDIRMGRVSNYLIYPFNFWEYHSASFLAFQCLQLLIAIFTLIILLSFNLLNVSHFMNVIWGCAFSFYVGFFWFAVQFCMGLLAFWLEETWVLRVIFQIVCSFLSGAIIPLDLYPKLMVKILDYTPFPYLTYFPIKIFSGETELLFKAFGMISIWIVIFMLINHFIWKRGVKLYTAAGM